MQTVPTGAKASAGHAPLAPLQLSATSQTPTAARQLVAALANASAGHAADVPLQFSATSQTPTAARQLVAALANASAGHVAAVPLHVSAVSQTPAEARQMVPAGFMPAATQTGTPVVHDVTPFSHGFAVAHAIPAVQPLTHTPAALQVPPVQTVPAGADASAGHVASAPVQVSAASH